MKFSKMVAVSLLALASVPAAAQGDIGLAVGATVYGPEGNAVGTITEVTDGYVMIDTGKHQAPFAPASFVAGSNGPRFGMTKAQIDSSVEEAEAKAKAALDAAYVAGATVYGANGEVAGSVVSIGDDGSALIASDGVEAALPREQFMANASGQLALRFTADALAEALAPLKQAKAAKEAALKAALVAGASLFSSDGLTIGKVREIDAEGNVVVDREATAFSLPSDQFTTNADGSLALRMTKAQFDAAMGG